MKTVLRFAALTSLGLLVALVVSNRPVEAVDETPLVAPTDGLRVLELFTSEGCSSCPPADRLLAELAQRDDVLALSFHVDYWNRLGWEDPFSLKRSTERQYWYANLFASSQVYTPQVVIGGQREAVGSRRSDVLTTLADITPAAKSLDVAVASNGTTRKVTVRTDAPTVNIAVVQPDAATYVERGENGGRTLSHVNVVRDFAAITPENGLATATLSVPSDVDDAFVVAYSQSRTGQITAAKIVQ